ncbi:hypothetical protein A6A27_06850 [Micromonospora sp. CB01531]|nr:hypothetical protein A6A27_06850 [Micromonospora sp. CB01531]
MRVVAAGTLMSGAAVTATATPAEAAALNCPYPYTCLYDFNKVMMHRYQVVTSTFQSVSDGADVAYGVNSRNDDVVFVRYTNGLVRCMPAGTPNTIYDVGYYGVTNGIRIDSSSSCGSTIKVPVA